MRRQDLGTWECDIQGAEPCGLVLAVPISLMAPKFPKSGINTIPGPCSVYVLPLTHWLPDSVHDPNSASQRARPTRPGPHESGTLGGGSATRPGVYEWPDQTDQEPGMRRRGACGNDYPDGFWGSALHVGSFGTEY